MRCGCSRTWAGSRACRGGTRRRREHGTAGGGARRPGRAPLVAPVRAGAARGHAAGMRRRDEAVDLLAEVVGSRPGRRAREAHLLRCLAPLAEATGDATVLAEADALLRGSTRPPGAAWLTGMDAYTAVARAWTARGEPGRAREVLRPLLAAATRTGWLPALAAGALEDGRAAARLGQRTRRGRRWAGRGTWPSGTGCARSRSEAARRSPPCVTEPVAARNGRATAVATLVPASPDRTERTMTARPHQNPPWTRTGSTRCSAG